MKTIIHGLVFISLCQHLTAMSVKRNRTSRRVLRLKTTSTTDQNATTHSDATNTSKNTTIYSMYEPNNKEFTQVANNSRDLAVQSWYTTYQKRYVPNTRLHEVVLRTPFVLSYDQRDTLARVVKKLWWNCRLLSRFMREQSVTTFTPSSLEKLRIKQIREQLKPEMQKELYYCDQCNKSFKLFLGIWNHMKSIHKIVVKPTRIVSGQIRGTYNMKNRYTTLKDYYEAHDDRR